MYVLCDINAAYVSFCQLFNPQFDFNKTPLAVLSSNQGNVIARNNATKALGIKMGEPAFKSIPIIKKHHGHVWGSNFALFGDISSRFHAELKPFLHEHFEYSIDEAFGKINLIQNQDLKNHAKLIKTTLQKNLGLSVGVGISLTKTLAKVASYCAKLPLWHDKTGGIVVLDNEAKIDWALSRIKLTDIWGVGITTASKLEKIGILNGLQLKNFDTTKARSLFSITLARTINELNGINSIELNDMTKERGRICVSRTMGKHITEQNIVRAALSSHASSAASKLRKFNLFTSSITVFIKTDQYRSDHNQYSKSVQVALPMLTNDTDIIIKYTLFALDAIYRAGYKYKKTGVVLEKFVSGEDQQQLNIFEDTKPLEPSNKTKVTDQINSKFGPGVIRFATQGYDHSFRPKNDLAPRSYTTRFADLPIAYAN
ncbi:Y-family DNA polymerase [Pseudoalteromonas prydzensis]|uniref:Y-family DNA polymerase n=1 Tax=Pseudoalteromonas prydzensis TaxID=182141 RepID=UPI003FD3BCA7